MVSTFNIIYTVTVGSDLEIPDNSQPSPVDSTHVTSWLSSVPTMTPLSNSSQTEAYDLLTSEEIKKHSAKVLLKETLQ